MGINGVSLVIFTCEGREYLLQQTLNSFYTYCDFKFDKIILAIDGSINPSIIDEVKPDTIIQSRFRNGYLNSIINAVRQINTPYFFWLEDDWHFHQLLQISSLLTTLSAHPNWVEIVFSKTGPLVVEEKINPLTNNLFQNVYGFSANPCLINTKNLKLGLAALEDAEKGDVLGEDGFENFLTKYFEKQQIYCAIQDSVDKQIITHEGYLESTPRNWHMTNSISNRTKEHLLTIPQPSIFRKFQMLVKIWIVFLKLGFRLFYDNKVYEYCFRIIATSITTFKK